MSKNPLITNIRRQLPHLPPMPSIAPLASLRLEQVLSPEKDLLHPWHDDFRRLEYNNPRLPASRRRAAKPIPCEDIPQSAPYGANLVKFGDALREIVVNFYPATGVTLKLPLTRRATRRNLMQLLEPIRPLVPQVPGTVAEWTEAMTFRQYFGELLGDTGEMPVPFPAAAYRDVLALCPYPHRLPKYTPCVDGDLRRPLAAVWDFYRLENLADPSLLELPLRAIADFLTPLGRELGDFYPTGVYLDSLVCDEESFWEGNPCFRLEFPSIHGDGDEYECINAFLEGPESVAAYVHRVWDQCRDEGRSRLAAADAVLIEREGLLRLVTHYATSDLGRKVPLGRIADHWNGFFGDWQARYPEAQTLGWWPDVITWTEQDIAPRCGRDIQLLRDYGHAFDNLLGAIPLITEERFGSEEALDKFLADLCRVYRLGDAAAALIEEDQADAA